MPQTVTRTSTGAGSSNELRELPEDPLIRIYDMECIRIVTSEVETMARGHD
jgi:hypothetical protein